MANDDVLDALAANLAQPKRARTDAGEVEQHDLAAQVEAVKTVMAMRSVTASPFRALRFAQTLQPNASGAADPRATSDIYPPPGVSGLPGYQ